jgi:hypothetical protein
MESVKMYTFVFLLVCYVPLFFFFFELMNPLIFGKDYKL